MNELQKQYDALVESVNAYKAGNKMGRAAALLRLSFVVDAALEALKEALLDKCVSFSGTREMLSCAVREGLVSTEQPWMKMVYDKDHINEAWDDGVAGYVYESIEGEYLRFIKELIDNLERQ